MSYLKPTEKSPMVSLSLSSHHAVLPHFPVSKIQTNLPAILFILMVVAVTFNLWWTKWHQARFFSKHFSFMLFLSFNQCSSLIHSSNYGAILPQQLSAFLNTTLSSLFSLSGKNLIWLVDISHRGLKGIRHEGSVSLILMIHRTSFCRHIFKFKEK